MSEKSFIMKSITARLIMGGLVWSILLTGITVFSINYIYERYQRDVYYNSLITKLKLLRDFHDYYKFSQQESSREADELSSFNRAILDYFDEQYDKAHSSWYWQVKGSDGTLHKSKSLQDCELNVNQVHCRGESIRDLSNSSHTPKPLLSGEITADFTYQIFPMKGALNQNLRVIISNYVPHQYLPYQYQYSLSGRYLGLDEIRSDLLLILAGALMVVTLGTLIAIYSSVKFGLKPIEKVRKKLTDIRFGKTEQLLGDFPPEIEPMVNEFHEVINKMNRVEVENLAHNLKTPLSVLMNESAKHSDSFSKLVTRQAKSMDHSINHYLDRSQRSMSLVKFQAITRLRGLLTEITEEFEHIAAEKRIQFSAELDSDISVWIDRMDLKECLQELTNNAIKSARSQVSVTISQYSNNVVINVEDDGKGVAKNMRNEVFKRAVKLDRTSAGSGIGLYAVNNRIMAWNGSVVLKTSSLGGLRVVITLPAASVSQV